MSRKRNNLFQSVEINDKFISTIQESIHNNLENNKPFIHGRLSPFKDIAIEKGRKSPFDENGIYRNSPSAEFVKEKDGSHPFDENGRYKFIKKNSSDKMNISN